jgi:hypothetical protein
VETGSARDLGAIQVTDNTHDWINDPSNVIRRQDAIAIYQNQAGDVVIRREADWNGEEDVCIIVSVQHVPTLVKAILREAGHGDIELIRHLGGIAYEDFEPVTDATMAKPVTDIGTDIPVPKDKTGAERQRRFRGRRNGPAAPVTVEPSRNGELPLREASQ